VTTRALQHEPRDPKATNDIQHTCTQSNGATSHSDRYKSRTEGLQIIRCLLLSIVAAPCMQPVRSLSAPCQ
jgi:hypothetical protein